jgi:wyosine [tRNA(Phe)-imidazoG37] synthetase (radical SAM superfamily)
VSLLPDASRLCNFDCVYCPFPRSPQHWSWPRPGNVGAAVASALRDAPQIDSITVSGPGEPTLHRQFGLALGEVLSARRIRPELQVRIVTNGSTLHEPRVRRLLEFADDRIVRIDAGGERVSRPSAQPDREGLEQALRQLCDFSVESIFVEGPAGNTSPREVEEWAARLGKLKPQRVYVTTIAQAPLEPAIQRANAEALERIADRLRRSTGLAATVIP